MSLLHFRCKERRRTLRVNLSVPLAVHGETDGGAKFCAHTHSMSINQHGALMELTEVVLVGQVLHLVNENSNRKVDCHVVSVQRKRDGKTYVGVEFVTAETNFWHMTFPMPGQKPLRKLVSQKQITA
jgi:PilZ domain